MTTVPPATPGVTWRPATEADLPAIVSLAAAVDAVERLEFAGGPEFWAWWLGQHDTAADTILAVAEDGSALALGGTYGTDSDRGARAILWFDAHPDHLDLEPALLAWVVGRARAQVAASAHPEKAVRVSAEEHRTRRRRMLEEAGFRAARSFVDMARPLTGDLPAARPIPDGVSVVPWAPHLDEAARLASNAAFADHWGSLPMSRDDWASMVMDEDTVRRDCSFVAMSGDTVVAVCLAEVDTEDDPAKLWIGRVGTHPDWQRRGLASALMVEAMRAGASAGLTTSSLSVDEESRFDATSVYARLGYTVTSRSITYLLEAT